MMLEHIKQLSTSLRLGAFTSELDSYLLQAAESNWSHQELLYHLLEREMEYKTEHVYNNRK